MAGEVADEFAATASDYDRRAEFPALHFDAMRETYWLDAPLTSLDARNDPAVSRCTR